MAVCCSSASLRLVEQPRVLDRDHRLVGERLQQRQFLVGERLDRLAQQADRTDAAPLPQHRHPHRREIADEGLHFTQRRGCVLQRRGVGDVHWRALAQDPGGDGLLERLGERANDRLHRRAVPGAGMQQSVVAEQEHADLFAGEELAATLRDLVEHRLRVGHRAADHPQHLGAGGLLLQRLLRLAVELRVLERDRRLSRQSHEELELVRLERAAAAAPHRHRALHRLAGEQRHDHQPLVPAHFGARDLHRARIGRRVVDELRPAAFDERTDDAVPGFHDCGLEVVGEIAERDQRAVVPAFGVGQEDGAVPGAKHLLGVTGDAVHHRREVERRRQVAAHVRQRRRFARVALRFREQPRVLQRDAHRCRDRRQEMHLRVVERVLALEALDRDRGDQALADHDGHEDARQAGVGARHGLDTDGIHRRANRPARRGGRSATPG